MKTRNILVMGVAALGLSLAATSKATLVFDDVSNFENGVSGAGDTTTGSTPNTFMGDGYTLTPATVDITGFDVYPVNLSGTNYTGLKITIYVWGTVNTGTVNATTPAFSNLLATYSLNSAPAAFNTGFIYSFESASPGVTPGISLTTPLVIPSTTIGLTFSYQGTTDGTTYATASSLTSLITYGTAPTVGSEVFNGYYRNANSETNGNFTSATRSVGFTNQSLAVRVYGDVAAIPEPGSWVMFVAAAGVLLALRKRIAQTA